MKSSDVWCRIFIYLLKNVLLWMWIFKTNHTIAERKRSHQLHSFNKTVLIAFKYLNSAHYWHMFLTIWIGYCLGISHQFNSFDAISCNNQTTKLVYSSNQWQKVKGIKNSQTKWPHCMCVVLARHLPIFNRRRAKLC